MMAGKPPPPPPPTAAAAAETATATTPTAPADEDVASLTFSSSSSSSSSSHRWILTIPSSSPLLGALPSGQQRDKEEEGEGTGTQLRDHYGTLLKVSWAATCSLSSSGAGGGGGGGGSSSDGDSGTRMPLEVKAVEGLEKPQLVLSEFDPNGPLSSSWTIADPNSMVRSIMMLRDCGSPTTTTKIAQAVPSGRAVHNSLVQDDWMERERSLATSAKGDPIAGHLRELAGAGGGPGDGATTESATSSSSSSTRTHLGDGFGPADVCLLSTLSVLIDGALLGNFDGKPTATRQEVEPASSSLLLPPALAAYHGAHKHRVEQARTNADRLLEKLREQRKSHQREASDGSSSSSSASLLKVLHGIFRRALIRARPELLSMAEQQQQRGGPTLPTYFVSVPKSGDRDYQCSLAMPVAALLQYQSKSKLPRAQDVANELVTAVQQEDNGMIVRDVKVVGPGFLCFNVSHEHLTQWINTSLLATQQLQVPDLSHQTIVVDFSSPNIAKEMHVGHLRSTIIGESVCRILEACGARVHRVNHVGDWGTQFGMLITYLQELRRATTTTPSTASTTTTTTTTSPDGKEQGGGDDSNDNMEHSIGDLTAFYKAAKERFDQDPDFKATSQQNVVKLQAGDPDCRKIWQDLCDISRMEFEKVYKRLDVSLEEVGESFYNDRIPPVLEEFERAGLLELDQSARVVRIDGHQVPLMLQKSDGGFGYDSTDMAALRYRLLDLKADRIIVITDFTQEGHFQMVYKAGHKIGWVQQGQRLQHIGFGTVMGEDGKRFKTRSGDTVRLVDLLDEAVHRMESQLRERIAVNKANITLDEVHEVAEAIGYGALKYFDLRRNPKSNYKFSYDEMLDTKGDTAVYLLYARVRLESIMTKALKEHGVNVRDLLDAKEPIVLGHESERRLALALAKFPDAMEETLDDLFPSHVCEYVYRVANAATDFVTQCKVLGSPEMRSRLLLCHVTALAIHQCFDLLGIRHVKRI